MCVKAHFRQIRLETQQTIFLTLYLGMTMWDSKVTSKAPKRVNVTYSDYFKLRNNIDFEMANLSIEMKRKEIEKYNPFHYIFGFTR